MPKVAHNLFVNTINMAGYNASLIALPKPPNLSMGGNEIIVEGVTKNPYVFFFTFRGIVDKDFDPYSGFLWVPDGGKPEQFMDANESGTEIVPFSGHWYFIGHR